MCQESKEKFQELYSLNVNKFVEKKQGLAYLTWSYAWAEFKKKYPEATYQVKKDENGRCYFGDSNKGYMVYTSVTADNLTYEMWLPVMDGANKAMKDEKYKYQTRGGEKSVEAISMFDVNKTVMRCLVKNLAMFGLGLYIYNGDDLPEEMPKEYHCAECGKLFENFTAKSGKVYNAGQMYHISEQKNGTPLCMECAKNKKESEDKNNE